MHITKKENIHFSYEKEFVCSKKRTFLLIQKFFICYILEVHLFLLRLKYMPD